jgi:predicted aldo/keto reductase-like oxidoreductase
MRLPTVSGSADVDETAAIEIMRYAVDHGVNYIDTAYPYHGGQSEVVVGNALTAGYRERVFVATKLPVWQVESPEDCDRVFDEQLARLQTDHVDFYLLHCLQKTTWPQMRQRGVLRWAEKLRDDGRIGLLGFSFHDSYDVFKDIVDGYDWSFCQIQYNFVNEEVQAGTRGLQYAAEKGLAVIVMEPLFGGTLANPPPPVADIWNTSPRRRPADVALRWLWNKPEVSLVLSGMSSLEQVKENLGSAGWPGDPWLDVEEAELIGRVQEKYRELSPIACTKCGYCMPCPHGVNIPLNFELYNEATVFRGSSVTLCRNLYHSLPEPERAQACEACGSCEQQCPQQLEIGSLLTRVAEAFDTT